MGRNIEITHLLVRAGNHSDCAHGCRYCPIKRRHSVVSRERYARLIERIRTWTATAGTPLSLYHDLGYHSNYDREDLEMLHRLDGDQAVRGITLGGLPQRSDDDLLAWLGMLREYGLKTVHATFGGSGTTHDRWNNQSGNYELLMRTLHAAGRLGLSLGQRLLVSRSTLPGLEELLDDLEALPASPGDWRYAMPFFYQTAAQKAQPHVESDRIDERMRDRMPPRLRALFSPSGEEANYSEREWLGILPEKDECVEKVTLILRINSRSIDELEGRPIGETMAKLDSQARRAYEAIPSFAQLRERYGDPSNTAVYAIRRCVEMKWLDAFRAEHPEVPFDQSVTHFWFGG